jgi:hypothetical protein
MKLLDIIFEDENKEKLIKRGKTIYKGFKTGVIRKGHFGNITYELPYEYDVQIDVNDEVFVKVGRNGSNNDIKFFHVDGTSGKVQPYSLTNKEYDVFVRAIERHKFKPFNIVLWYDQTEDMNQLINEDAEVDVPKEKKRVKTIFRALRSGVMFVPFLGYKIKYELNNDYQLSVGIGKGHSDTILFIPSDDKTPKIKLYEIGSDGVERYFEVNGYDSIYQLMWQMISQRFKNFKIHLR